MEIGHVYKQTKYRVYNPCCGFSVIFDKSYIENPL